ncbi:glutathione S-transferase family protein [Piscinibacter terrae]|uniref:Glutathione S-transferase family protein n=1 Tax=Piscinibacter terrae TaxID=2496871 RepID=A0A3N7HW53_9BURK|nr:glutathione S-transferase family protein [Albitalea terrae]RQP26608.1 glutathione S-transferase family protein [Albitalea terrae]
MQLYIGNKNYSSWSLRPWLLMTQSGIQFEEIKLRLSFTDESDFKKTLAKIAPSGRVPVLVDEGFAVWDTLAIAEYLAEKYPSKNLWPVQPLARARARSLCAEMHAGFGALRNHFGMNIEAHLPEIGQRVLAEQPDAARDFKRIVQMWEKQFDEHGGPFLFGSFSIADAYYAPVCSRIATYALPVPQRIAAYVDRIHALPAMQSWIRDAKAEHDFIAEDEPYRTSRAG